MNTNHTGNREELDLLKLHYEGVLQELQWKLLKKQRAHSLLIQKRARCWEQLEKGRTRLKETMLALAQLSESHPFQKKLQEDAWKTRIRIEKLERRLSRFSDAKAVLMAQQIQLLQVQAAHYLRLVQGIEEKIAQTPKKESRIIHLETRIRTKPKHPSFSSNREERMSYG